jgi:PAS domain S-box-containing protein
VDFKLRLDTIIFEHVSEGVLIVDSLGVIRKVNKSASRIFGYLEEELLGQKIEILIPTSIRHSHVKTRENYQSEPKARSMGVNQDLRGLKKNNEEFPLEVSLNPCKVDGEQFIVAFIQDITVRKEAENQLINYKNMLEDEVEDRMLILKEAIAKLEITKVQLDQSLQKEREVNSMKNKFISIASHEFRTPLATILSSLSLAERYSEKNDAENRDKHFQKIKKSVRNLTEILNDILSVNKLEEGKVEVCFATYPLKEIIENGTNEISGILKANQKLVIEDFSSENATFVTDKKLVRHILQNLLTNAVKFSHENNTIILRIETDEETTSFSVIDQGIGIPEDEQANLFTRFYRSSNVGNIQGTGLGLSIVAQYTELLNGEVSLNSIENVGSTFRVTFKTDN